MTRLPVDVTCGSSPCIGSIPTHRVTRESIVVRPTRIIASRDRPAPCADLLAVALLPARSCSWTSGTQYFDPTGARQVTTSSSASAPACDSTLARGALLRQQRHVRIEDGGLHAATPIASNVRAVRLRHDAAPRPRRQSTRRFAGDIWGRATDERRDRSASTTSTRAFGNRAGYRADGRAQVAKCLDAQHVPHGQLDGANADRTRTADSGEHVSANDASTSSPWSVGAVAPIVLSHSLGLAIGRGAIPSRPPASSNDAASFWRDFDEALLAPPRADDVVDSVPVSCVGTGFATISRLASSSDVDARSNRRGRTAGSPRPGLPRQPLTAPQPRRGHAVARARRPARLARVADGR